MPTLKEFVDGVIAENNMTADSEEIIKKITEIARERAGSQKSVAIADEEIREMVINYAELSTKLAAEHKARLKETHEKMEAERKQREAERAEEKKQKAIAKEKKVAGGEQMGLFDL